MAWTPDFNVFDFRNTGQNLLDYVEANQQDALIYAGGAGLKLFEKFYTNASGRRQTIFPSLMILAQAANEDMEEALGAEFTLGLEATIGGPEPNQLVADTKIYDFALRSMLANMPSTTLMAGSMQLAKAYLVNAFTEYDFIESETGIPASPFMQIFRIRATWQLQTGGII